VLEKSQQQLFCASFYKRMAEKIHSSVIEQKKSLFPPLSLCVFAFQVENHSIHIRKPFNPPPHVYLSALHQFFESPCSLCLSETFVNENELIFAETLEMAFCWRLAFSFFDCAYMRESID
jgi:hypothetical protein